MGFIQGYAACAMPPMFCSSDCAVSAVAFSCEAGPMESQIEFKFTGYCAMC